jgi:hypothetical protein
MRVPSGEIRNELIAVRKVGPRSTLNRTSGAGAGGAGRIDIHVASVAMSAPASTSPIVQFHDEELLAIRGFKSVDCRDVGMIQRCKDACFTLEARDTIPIMRERLRKKFDGDVSAERRVRGLVHVTHSARTQMRGDFVVRESRADHRFLRTAPEVYQSPLAQRPDNVSSGRVMIAISVVFRKPVRLPLLCGTIMFERLIDEWLESGIPVEVCDSRHIRVRGSIENVQSHANGSLRDGRHRAVSSRSRRDRRC